ncbi:MAG: tRNA lysidine(34) synthetase TilS [Glaciecola sp.]
MRLQNQPVFVALSGGLDSVFLLHILSQAWPQDSRFPLRAVHVNHNLHPDSRLWANFCVAVSKGLNVTCSVLDVQIEGRNNLEAKAREARYDAIAQHVPDGAIIVLAQHANDQFETLLLNLKRGAGSRGLVGMPRWRQEQHMTLFRPLLTLDQASILDYANTHQLTWVDDPSNRDEGFSRNFIRHTVLAPLIKKWSFLPALVGRTLAHLQSDLALLDEVVWTRCEAMTNQEGRLALDTFQTLSTAWQQKILHTFLKENHSLNLSQANIKACLQMLNAKSDAQGCVQIGQVYLYRYAQQLWVESHYRALTATDIHLFVESACRAAHILSPILDAVLHIDSAGCQDWRGILEDGQSLFVPIPDDVDPDELVIMTQSIALSHMLKPWGAGHSKPLKQWCKLLQIPFWQRGEAQLLLVNSHPVAVTLGHRLIPLQLASQSVLQLSC